MSRASASEIQDFYDQFMESRMIDYRLHGSKRLDRAKKLVESVTARTSVVLDVGCGTGIMTDHLGRIARDGHVLGIDISERSIWYAQRTVDRPNVTFLRADVVSELDRVREALPAPADVVVLIDTIEHIKDSDRAPLLEALSRLCSPSATLAITFPSPQYQRFLMENDPDELQIIDNVVEPEVLFSEARRAGFDPVYYRLVDSGRANQYAHCVFRCAVSVDPVPWSVGGMLQRLPGKIARCLTYPVRVYRYRHRVFRNVEEKNKR